MARGHKRFIESVAIVGLWAAAPLAAQTTAPATQIPAPTPTPSPAPTGDAVGPPQLRDFNLNGTVTQPVQQPTPAPRPTTPSATPEPRAAPAPVSAAPDPVQRRPTVAAPDRNPARDAVNGDLPPPGAAPIAPEPSFAPAPATEFAPPPAVDAPLAADESPANWWPWLAALLALGLGAAFLWSRRQRSGRERYAADGADLGALGATPAAPTPLPRAAQPQSPRPAPRSPLPAGSRLPPRPAPVQPTPPAPAPASPPAPGGIVASGLKPKIEFELVPIRAETDDAEGAALIVDIIVMNRGSAPARDVLVEAALINAGPRVDSEIGLFFSQPASEGERVPVIPPMSSVAIKVRLEVAGTKLAPLVVEGRKLLVPLVAVNAFYRWSGGEITDSSSFLVGRGEADGGKLAPFRIDRGARSWTGLVARLHSSGLERR